MVAQYAQVRGDKRIKRGGTEMLINREGERCDKGKEGRKLGERRGFKTNSAQTERKKIRSVLNMRLCTTMNRGKVRENKEEKKNNKITGQGDD